MRHFILAALALAIGATQAPAQAPQQSQQQPAPRTYSQADLWDRGAEWITFRPGNVSLPTTLGSMRLDRSLEASQEGQGLDNALLYFSPDRAVLASVYIYAPA